MRSQLIATLRNIRECLCIDVDEHDQHAFDTVAAIAQEDLASGPNALLTTTTVEPYTAPKVSPQTEDSSNVAEITPGLHSSPPQSDRPVPVYGGQQTSVTTIPRVISPEECATIPFPVHRGYKLSTVELEGATLDILPVSTPCTFRLMDCRRFAKERTLTIYETYCIPTVPYMTISYPWVGIVCNEQVLHEGKTFKVYTAETGINGDPISTSILNRICFLAMVDDINFLWIDRLCIRQGDPVDKKWQMERMCNVFRQCHVCLVIPGGLQRLANVYEETPWITRAWTLPEVLAAPTAQIMTTFAPTSLNEFLWGSTDPLYGMRLFGRQRHRSFLVDALSLRSRSSTDKQKYYRNLTIWKCALIRAASNIEDLLPSVIGLFETSEEGLQLESLITQFKKEVCDPYSRDLRVIAFRDAVFLSGINISAQWQELIRSIPALALPEEEKWQTSQPCIIPNYQSPWERFPISNAYKIALSELQNTVHDISSVSTPCAFRLLDCKRYIEEHTVVIYETPDIPNVPYAAISYPWVGAPCHYFAPTSSTFKVIQDTGRLGDPICTEVVHLACTLSIREGADFLWVDRLCIRQMDSKDKAWQISRMCDVYRLCHTCIIFPGGLQRLVGLDEETPWVTRMWTLQEAIVPSRALVLYFSTDSQSSQNSMLPPPHAKALTSTNLVYYSPLEDLLPTTMTKKDSEIRLFGHVSHGYALLLRDAISLQGQDVTYEQRYQRYLATWRSAVTRSSDRPQDLLLSTMGLFGISLSEGEQRSSATIIAAFVNEFQNHGIADVRVVAFRDAVRRAETTLTMHWRQLIEEFDRSLPLLHNGIAPTSDHQLPLDRIGKPVVHDGFGQDVFLGSALLITGAEHSLHPCKIVLSSSGAFSPLVPFDGHEKEHEGRWELQPFLPERMEWVDSAHGEVPLGREPVEGGYEKDARYRRQRSLYYALATVIDDEGRQEQVPGKTGLHLGGCCVGFGGKEHFIREDYMILCWKESAQVAMKTAVNAKLDDELFWGRPNLPMVSGLPVIQADR
ncbi:unnamed protein product [Somion occarium]|uniref:Heterokaryon incompatibility domain-containing protein n=1 Tax=Somion occarium TaxID=3059160 RepID=A0ABP1DF15_9APHY